MTALALLWGVAAPLGLGLLAVRALGLGQREGRIAGLAWGWLLGCLGLGAMVQLAIEVGLSPNWWWTLPLLPIAVLSAVSRRRPAGPARASTDLLFASFALAGALFCLWFVLAGMDRPCVEGDEGNIWSLKAKSLLVDFPAQFQAAQVYNLHPDYPQLNPLLQAWVYALCGTGEFVQFENRWPIQLCNVALFGATAAALRHRLARRYAVPLALLLLLEPEFQSLCRTAYADGMVALGLVVGLDGWLRWRDDDGHRGHLWLAGLGLAFALWSKNETMLYLVSAAAAAALVRLWLSPRRGGLAPRNLLALLPAVGVITYTTLWNRRFAMQSDLLGANPTGKTMFTLMAEQWPERVPALLAEAAHATLALDHVHALFAVTFIAVAALPKVALGARLALPLLALAGSLVGLHIVYVGSFLPLRFHLDTSYLRVLFQLLPVTIVLLGALIAAVVAGDARRQTSTPA